MSFTPTPINPTTDSVKPSPFIAFTQRVIPATFDESLSYQEALYAILKYLNDMSETVNANADITEQQTAVIEQLTDYVNHYFDNLDVQEEINNKLDQMAEDGTLAEIVTAYINAKGVLGYKTLAELEAATNIIDGSICYIIGKDTYNDGKCAFYLIRTVTSGDVVDGDNIIAVEASNTLIGEKLPNYYITDLYSKNEGVKTDLQNLIDDIARKKQLHATKEVKFCALEDGTLSGGLVNYYYERNLKSDSYSLPMISLNTKSGTFSSVQGCAVWNKTGQVIYVNGTQIYTVSYSRDCTPTVLYTDNFGHGGDCCIIEDNIYITDSDNNNIYKVNLQNGSKTTYSLNDNDIKNGDHEYAPKLAGICMSDDKFAYICVCDEEDTTTGHTIKDGSTIRVYTYKFSDGTVTPLFDMPQDMVYIQGMTKDNDYFYIIGNKEFTSSYTGSKLHIINVEDFTIFDTLENNENAEFEGIDYGCTRGYEGLFTVCANDGNFAHYGVLSFYGNYISVHEATSGNNKMTITVADKICTLVVHLEGTFNANTTVEFNNFLSNLVPTIRAGGTSWLNQQWIADWYDGGSRNYQALIILDFYNNKLKVLTGTNSPNATKVDAKFTFPVS